jgi:hypothetical protein
MVTENNTGIGIPATHPETMRRFWRSISESGEVREVRVLDTRSTGPNRFFGVQ